MWSRRQVSRQTGAKMALAVWLWKVWKWIVKLFTGKCELQRLVESKLPLEERTHLVEQSIRNSQNQAVRSIALDSTVSVEEAMDVLVKEKNIKLTSSVRDHLSPILLRIHSLCLLWTELDSLAQQPFTQSEDDEELLLELWQLLCPDTPLEMRLTKQWQDIGFQGKDPATDFRGMGMLGLHCLHYFAKHHQEKARSILSHSHHPQYHYPYAVVGIHITAMVHGWMDSSLLSHYLYTTSHHWPVLVEDFMEIYCYLFDEFDGFWQQKKPENVMQFSPIKKEFENMYAEKLAEKEIRFLMKLENNNE